MNQEARAELDRILAIEPAALTEPEMAFLQARRGYLTEIEPDGTHGRFPEEQRLRGTTSGPESHVPPQ